ncbi:hypothetical protein B0T26DRAFT_749664 [Lasiosphaeria miniovina]|uniref:Uncharacterized protein n=1 Tax=Lasiosphaeria miniovina TaxID=1954250 RepID=A0AA40AUL0_9PEZI|nr:uncharacterized protein B0T26DRAFT_749664 [Lasiosphaeria miniovina]KAK0722243.1 hypothetical protein B0T26DRAFT_749664 [Lasiosphaeria miniovina]
MADASERGSGRSHSHNRGRSQGQGQGRGLPHQHHQHQHQRRRGRSSSRDSAYSSSVSSSADTGATADSRRITGKHHRHRDGRELVVRERYGVPARYAAAPSSHGANENDFEEYTVDWDGQTDSRQRQRQRRRQQQQQRERQRRKGHHHMSSLFIACGIFLASLILCFD